MAVGVIFVSVSACFAEEADRSSKSPIYENLTSIKTEKSNKAEEENNRIGEENNKVREEKNKIITEEKAEEIAERAFEKYFNMHINKDEFDFIININFDYDDKSNFFWNMSWCKDDGQTLYATVNGRSGEITYMSDYEYSYNDKASKKVILWEEAKNVTTKFLKEINNKKLKETSSPILYEKQHDISGNYTFKYERNVNGIDFKGNYIIVRVNAFSGKVTEYECVWDDELNFPQSKNIVDIKTAANEFRNNLKIELSYIKVLKEEDGKVTSEIKLVYMPVLAPGDYLDAVNGEMVEFNADLDKNVIDLTQEEKNMLSEKYRIIKKYGLDKKDEKSPFRLTWKESYYKALDAIAQYYPDKIKNIKTEQYEFKNYIAQYATFNFPRMEEGILYFDNAILVDIDMNTGKVYDRKCIWEDDISFPDRQKILSIDDIKEIIFEKYKPKLVYDIVNTPDGIMNNRKVEVKLIYEHNLGKNIFIDANTGQFIVLE